MRKKWKRNRVILPLLLSAVMVVEPVAAATTVYAEESEPTIIVTGVEQTEEPDADEIPVEGVEDSEQDIGSPDEADIEKNDSQEAEDNTDDIGGEDVGSSSEDTDNQDDSSEDSLDKEDREEPDAEVDGEEELPDEELSNEELTDEDSADEEDAPDEEELAEDSEENADVEVEENEALNGFAGMPSTYKLTSEQLESKRSLVEHAGEFSGFREGSDYVKGQVVTFADTQEEAELIAKAYNAEIERFEYGILTLKLSDDVSVSTAIMVAADTELNMPAVWPNYYRYLLEGETASGSSVTETSDGIEIETSEYELDELAALGEEFSNTSYAAAYNDPALKSDDPNYQWHHTVIGSPYAWAEGYTGQGIKVAVLDTGVAGHNDLPGITTLNSSGNSDNVGHGTHVAGIIAARGNNNLLGSGVAPGAALYSFNLYNSLGQITSDYIMSGINAAVSNRVDLINMSIGGLGYIQAEETVIEKAYNAGIAIFASAGNDGGQTYSYPACYKHVISVAATDKNNERASFSTYNNMVDLSAPGVAIWSASNTSANSYVPMDGTSMACPVAVGEAAVILSGNGELRNMTGGDRVDALEKLMKANTTSAGSGMGSGITSLTKVFKLSTAEAKPNAPEITIASVNTGQGVKVSITAQQGAVIYYTKNGKNPAFKNGEPDEKNGTELYKEEFTINDSTSGTIKAIAVNESGVSSTVKSEKYTLKLHVTSIEISGVQNVAKGKSIQLTAEVLPAYAANKQVSWTLQNADTARANGVTITGSGKVTASKDARTGSYTVVATANDEGGISSKPYTIMVIDAVKIGSVKFGKKSLTIDYSTAEKVEGVSLVTVAEFNATLNDVSKSPASPSDFVWTSSNKTVATVDAGGVVTPKKAGKATITALANDSSGKKATCTVTVTQLATNITITGTGTVAAGKSVTLKAEVKPADVKNKKVTWELYKGTAKVEASAGVSINASGKVTTKKTAQTGEYTVRAVAKDNGQAVGEKKITVTDGIINKLSFEDSKQSKITICRKDPAGGALKEETVKITIQGDKNTADLDAYSVTNSAKGIATVKDSRAGNTITLTIVPTGKATGKTSITVSSTDGSNKKVTCTVTVVNPASGVRIAPAAGNGGYVVQGKSLQLKATVESEFGALSNKNVTWELYTANGTKVNAELERSLGVKIASNGKVTAAKDAKQGGTENNPTPAKYVVRATAKDGSGVYGTYTISVGIPATWITLCQDPTCDWNKPGASYNWELVLTYSEDLFLSSSTRWKLNNKAYYTLGIIGDIWQGGFTVSSSNPAVVSVSYEAEYLDAGYLNMATYKSGSATVTIKAMDGSGKQIKYNFVVQ